MAKNYVTEFRGEFTPNKTQRIKDEPITPDYGEEYFGNYDKLDFPIENEFTSMRKSMSMNDIAILNHKLENVKFESEEYPCQVYRKQNRGSQELSRTKFVSMAEAIYHYQKDTPTRFRSAKPKQCQNVLRQSRLTLAQSPHLRCKERSRPRHVISQKEKEEMELEEIKKFKLKANPIPKSVIVGPHLPEVPKKPITIPEPFKLTEIQKRNIESSEETHTFKARPAPKQILEKPYIPVKLPPQITKPVSPKFHYKRAKSTDSINYDNKQCNSTKMTCQQDKSEKKLVRHGPMKPEPFSFLKRDEEIKKRKEEWIRKQIEEERRLASQFKAQPLPFAVKKNMRTVSGLAASSSTASSENKENFKFEAKQPVVLYKEPFKPVLHSNNIAKQVPFELSTEKRAAEREKFEKHLKEKEQDSEKFRQQMERERQEAEEREISKMRAKLVHHPKPIPAPNPFIPKTSGHILTVPETPKFIRRMKQKQI